MKIKLWVVSQYLWGIKWAYEADILVILNGLLFWQEFNFQNIVLVSDSSIDVGGVGNAKNKPWKLRKWIKQNRFSVQIKEVSCIGVWHIFREIIYVLEQGCNRQNDLWAFIDIYALARYQTMVSLLLIQWFCMFKNKMKTSGFLIYLIELFLQEKFN